MLKGSTSVAVNPHANITEAEGEEPVFATGDTVRVCERFPISHYRMPLPIRGKRSRGDH